MPSAIPLTSAVAPHTPRLAAAASVAGLVDWRYRSSIVDYDAPLADRIVHLGEIIGRQMCDLATMDAEQRGEYVICSSYLPKILIDVPERVEQLMQRIFEVCGRRPSGLVQTYECASWGYVWRCHAQHCGAQDLTITVVDACLHGFEHYAVHPSVGASGFGLTSVRLRLPDDHASRCATVEVDGPYPDSGFKEFIRALRFRRARVGSGRVMVPFFREDLGAIANRIVGAECVTRNRNAEHGHCFGSDPWIALAEEVCDGTVTPGDLVTLGTLAYNGYFAVADVIAPDPSVVRQRIWS